MLTQAINDYPIGLILAFGVTGIVVVFFVVRGLLELFIAWAEEKPDTRPHLFNPRYASHCDRCWDEARRRHSEARLRQDWPPLHVVDREVRR
jgi:hypothetical protein